MDRYRPAGLAVFVLAFVWYVLARGGGYGPVLWFGVVLFLAGLLVGFGYGLDTDRADRDRGGWPRDLT